MDVQVAMKERRTIYRFEERAVPDDVVMRALDAARWAPNHRLTEPWSFIIVGPETKRRLGEVARRLARLKAKDADAGALDEILEKQVKKVTGVPVLIVAVQTKTPSDPMLEREDYAAMACAIQNLQLSLWSDGVGVQWGTGGPTRDDETYAVVGVDQSTHTIVGFLKIGFPRETPTSKRKPVDEIVRRLP